MKITFIAVKILLDSLASHFAEKSLKGRHTTLKFKIICMFKHIYSPIPKKALTENSTAFSHIYYLQPYLFKLRFVR